MDEFSAKVSPQSWPKLNETQVQFNELNVMLSKYQNPKEADAMTKIQQDLDDTKIILVKKKLYYYYYLYVYRLGVFTYKIDAPT